MPEDLFHTRATVLLPGALSYCIVRSEEHYEALRATYPTPTWVMEELACSTSSSNLQQAECLLWALEDETTTNSFCEYQPFHLDFGPWTWMQHCQLLAALQVTRRDIGHEYRERRRKTNAAARRHRNNKQASGRNRVLQENDDTPSEGSSSSSTDSEHGSEEPQRDNALADGQASAEGGAWSSLYNAEAGPMILLVVRLHLGLKHTTNLLTALGVMSVLSGVIKSAGDLETYFPLETVRYWTVPFHDATPYDDVEAHFELTMEDAVLGALHAFRLWHTEMVDVERFVVAHDHFQRLEHGDVSFIAPWRFVACASPANDSDAAAITDASPIPKPATYYASTFGDPRSFYGCVDLVIQLNDNISYSGQAFRDAGVQHKTLFFPDGSCPPTHIVAEFFDLIDRVPHFSSASEMHDSNGMRRRTAVALHCMAGLGRTGTLICLALMRDYGFTAKASIAWARLCRPGSVIGPQQSYLCYTEARWKQSIFDHTILGTPSSVGDTAQQPLSHPTQHKATAKKTNITKSAAHKEIVKPQTSLLHQHSESRTTTAPGGHTTNGMSSSRATTPTSSVAAAVVEVDRTSLVEVLINRRVSSRSPSTTTATELLDIEPIVPTSSAGDGLQRRAQKAATVANSTPRDAAAPPGKRETIAYRDANSGTSVNTQHHDHEKAVAAPVLSRYTKTTDNALPLLPSTTQVKPLPHTINVDPTHHSKAAAVRTAATPPSARTPHKGLDVQETAFVTSPPAARDGTKRREKKPSTTVMTTYTVGQLLQTPQRHAAATLATVVISPNQHLLPPSVQSWLDEDAQRLRSPPHDPPAVVYNDNKSRRARDPNPLSNEDNQASIIIPSRSLLGLSSSAIAANAEVTPNTFQSGATSPPKLGATLPTKHSKQLLHREDHQVVSYPTSSAVTTASTASVSTVHRISITL
ncbi:dual specificity protein phosphatase, putative [Bodo saltans]|uniref:protein-tyrosine-phosphatase n=1 Tax=Bodo saltans TaxID=75058 RepID=A0A0S4JDZ4_BODSA|nr:dual specificity protein phosphatase, putative [Bodo saltans]|eukprot:CUG89786.1 dual specificity protein phosphatase, putative [Bodo saltans]